MKDTDTLVLFRMMQGECLALMPLEPGTSDPYTCACYAHVGQHGSADPNGCIRGSRPATPEEYGHLKRELESLGYIVTVGRKTPRNALETRRAKLRKTGRGVAA